MEQLSSLLPKTMALSMPRSIPRRKLHLICFVTFVLCSYQTIFKEIVGFEETSIGTSQDERFLTYPLPEPYHLSPNGYLQAQLSLIDDDGAEETVDSAGNSRVLQKGHKALAGVYRPKKPAGLKKNIADLRIACFGDSDVWRAISFNSREGEYVMDYRKTRFDATATYCSKIGADNYAFPSKGPNYAATCLETMIGDNLYDVLIVDFALNSPTQSDHLFRRLRQRFPQATIIQLERLLLKKVKFGNPGMPGRQVDIEMALGAFAGGRRKRHWAPLSTRRISREKYIEFIKDRKIQKEKNIIEEQKQREKLQKLKDKNGKAPKYKPRRYGLRSGKWELRVGNSYKEENEKLSNAYKTIQLKFGDEDELEDSMLDMMDDYYDDGCTLSHHGHNRLSEMLIETLSTTSITRTTAGNVGTFGDGDYCDVWFTNGEMPPYAKGSGAQMNNYVDIRHGIEFTSPDPNENYISIHNPFDKPRALYISFLTTPPPHRGYQDARLRIKGTSIDMVIEANGFNEYQMKHTITTAKTMYVGELSPGTHEAFFLNQGTGANPFRLAGYSFPDTTKGNGPIDYEFTQRFWYKGFTVIYRGELVPLY
mmetsp:Transcript_20092/g.31031  ORF Transcript_20092/g.31031 Transcript_20092/m.31031 type:complete len:593 (-) Transcript_20092:88-1866(-)